MARKWKNESANAKYYSYKFNTMQKLKKEDKEIGEGSM
jgi:hypothetical protein